MRTRGRTTLTAGWLGVLTTAMVASLLVSAAPVAQANGRGQSGSCSGVANGSGISLYCLRGDASTLATIAQLLGGRNLRPCMHSRVPAGMKPPVNQTGEDGEYWVRSCLTDVDLDTISGGEDVGVALDFDFVAADEDPVTYQDLSVVEQRIWRRIEHSGYPIPFTALRPTHTARVNQYTFFQFRWMVPDGQGDYEVSQAPGQPDDGNGTPYIQIGGGDTDTQARAQSVNVRVDPNIKGQPAVDCGPDPAVYDFDADPLPDEQASDCWVIFEHSSAAAEELGEEIPLPDGAEEYPVPVYVVTVTVTWAAEMQTGDGAVISLGEHESVVQQAIPVTEIPGLVGRSRG